MARYWIRNRGRVQGPFSEERIQGLLRRGRFSRHFHVSEDRKNWYPAGDFPELFAGAGGGPEPDDDDGPFQSGGSPFDEDDDFDDPPEQSRGKKKKPSKRRAPVPDDDEEEDEDEDDDAWDDEEWEDDDSGGVLTGLVDWIEANVKVLAAVLVLVLGVLMWFIVGGEDFTQDTADLETLKGFQSQIVQAHQSGADAGNWLPMMESIQAELAPMVGRLKDTASATDHVKQTLLFVARDDIPGMLKELPANKQDAAQRVIRQLAIVEDMIKNESRFSQADALMAPQMVPQNTSESGGNNPTGAVPPAGSPGSGQPQTSPRPGQAVPGSGTRNSNPGTNPASP